MSVIVFAGPSISRKSLLSFFPVLRSGRLPSKGISI